MSALKILSTSFLFSKVNVCQAETVEHGVLHNLCRASFRRGSINMQRRRVAMFGNPTIGNPDGPNTHKNSVWKMEGKGVKLQLRHLLTVLLVTYFSAFFSHQLIKYIMCQVQERSSREVRVLLICFVQDYSCWLFFSATKYIRCMQILLKNIA